MKYVITLIFCVFFSTGKAQDFASIVRNGAIKITNHDWNPDHSYLYEYSVISPEGEIILDVVRPAKYGMIYKFEYTNDLDKCSLVRTTKIVIGKYVISLTKSPPIKLGDIFAQQ